MTQPGIDRESGNNGFRVPDGPGHRFDGDPRGRGARAERLQRILRVHLFAPLLLFNREGDCLAAELRPGNVHSAEGWEELLLPEIERQQGMGKEVAFRGDAAFAKPFQITQRSAQNPSAKTA